MTFQELKDISYRKERFIKKARSLEQQLLGLDRSVEPFTHDADGNYSEEKTRALVEALVLTMERCSAFQWADGPLMTQEEKERELEALPVRTSGYERQFYSDFLYCALRLRDSFSAWELTHARTTEVRTFQDLLGMMDELAECPDEEEALMDLEFRNRCPGFFGLADYCYERLSGHGILQDLATPAQLEQLREAQQNEDSELLALLAEAPVPEDLDPEDLDAAEPELSESDLWRLEELEKENAMYAAMTHRAEFIETYLSLRRKWYLLAPSLRMMRQMLEEGLTLFLYREGMTYLDDETFFPAYGLLDKTGKRLGRLFSEEG